MNLTIFKANFLGDNVVFLPVVQELRRRFPDWRITLISHPHYASLYHGALAPAEVFTVLPDDLRQMWRRPQDFFRWWSILRDRRPDATLVSYDQGSVAHALAWLAGGKLRVGGAGHQVRLRSALTHHVDWRPGWSIAQWNWEIARALLKALGKHDWPATPPPPDVSHLAAGTARHPRRIVIHAGSKRAYTQWPLERFTALAAQLARDCEVHWITAPDTRRVALPAEVKAVESAELPALARHLAGAALFIGNNSGPMHVANALGTPLVVVTGPTDFTWDPAWHPANATVLRTPGLACQPCERVNFLPGHCTNQLEPLACLNRWSVDDVERACRARLAASPILQAANR